MPGARHRLILLLGSPRSGTSWLATILDSHPGVVYSHEVFSRLRRPGLSSHVRRLKNLKNTGFLEAGELRGLLHECCQADPEWRRPPFFAKDFLRLPASFQWLLWLLVRLTHRGEGAFRRLFSPGDHQPFDLLIKEVDWARHTLALVQALDPELLLIVRHPCAVVASILRGQRLGLMAPSDRSPWYQEHQPWCERAGFRWEAIRHMQVVEFLALQWLVQNLAYQAAVKTHRRSHVVVYEELCDRPLSVTQAVFAFLGWKMGRQTFRFLGRSTRGETIPIRTWLQGKQTYFGVLKDPERSRDAWKTELTGREQDQVLAVARALPEFAAYWPA